MAQESGKGINGQKLGRADVIPRNSLDELLLFLEGTVHQDSIYLGREGNISTALKTLCCICPDCMTSLIPEQDRNIS